MLCSVYEFPPPIPDNICIYKIQCQHSPLYLGGRYNKYSRELPQTPWFVNGERKMESSVNELIADIVQKRIKCDSTLIIILFIYLNCKCFIQCIYVLTIF